MLEENKPQNKTKWLNPWRGKKGFKHCFETFCLYFGSSSSCVPPACLHETSGVTALPPPNNLLLLVHRKKILALQPWWVSAHSVNTYDSYCRGSSFTNLWGGKLPDWGSEIRQQENGDDRIQKESPKGFNLLKSKSWEKLPEQPQAGQFILVAKGNWKELWLVFLIEMFAVRNLYLLWRKRTFYFLPGCNSAWWNCCYLSRRLPFL